MCMTSSLSPEAFVVGKIEAALHTPQQASSEISPEDARYYQELFNELASFNQDSTPEFPPTTTPVPQGEYEVVTDLATPAKMYEQFLPVAASNGRFPTNPQVPAELRLREKVAAAQEDLMKILYDLGVILGPVAFIVILIGLYKLLETISGLRHFPKS